VAREALAHRLRAERGVEVALAKPEMERKV